MRLCKTFIKLSKAVRSSWPRHRLKRRSYCSSVCSRTKSLYRRLPYQQCSYACNSHILGIPIKRMAGGQGPFCLNTDNRTVSNTTLTNEYLQMAHHCDMTESEMRFKRNCRSAFFAEAADKAVLLKKFKNGNSNKHGR